MVDKADITGSIPTSSTINIVADGEIIDASIENTNNQQLLQISTLLYQFVRDDCPSLSVANTFTAEQIFNILKATQIQPAVTNGDITLNPNGTGKVRYADGSNNTEVASKGYVNLTTGNIPSGGTAGTWLEGDGSWSDPIPAGGTAGNWLEGDGSWSDPSAAVSTVTTTSTLAGNSIYLVDPSAGGITLSLPSTASATMKPIKLIPDGVNSWETDNYTLSGNGSNIIVLNADGSVETASATIDITSNVPMTVYCNGTQYIVMGGA